MNKEFVLPRLELVRYVFVFCAFTALETYRKIQDENYISDFDREIRRIQGEFEK